MQKYRRGINISVAGQTFCTVHKECKKLQNKISLPVHWVRSHPKHMKQKVAKVANGGRNKTTNIIYDKGAS